MNRIRAAVIADEFTKSCLESVWEVCNLDATSAIAQLDAFQPDILFVESAWRGANDSWEKTITGKSELLKIITDSCREKEVPSLFWNKEDPVHFNHFSRRSEITKLFDIMLTTEVNCIPEYKSILGHNRVYFFPFFADTLRFYPSARIRVPGYCFAGSWYKRYPERNSAFLHIYSLIKKEQRALDIFDRNYQKADADLEFPSILIPHVKGKLAFNEIDKAYGGYEIGVTLNTVTDGQSMFARRAVEMMSCGTEIVSNYTRAISSIFRDFISTVSLHDEMIRHTQKTQDEYFSFIREHLGIDYLCNRITKILQQNFSHRTFPETEFMPSSAPQKSQASGITLIEQLSDYFTLPDTVHWYSENGNNIFCDQSLVVTNDQVKAFCYEDKLRILSCLDSGVHAYVNFVEELSTEKFPEFVNLVFIANNDNLELDIWQFDECGVKIQRDLFASNRSCKFRIEPRSKKIKIGFRVIGPGDFSVEVLREGKLKRIPDIIIPIHRMLYVIQTNPDLREKLLNNMPVFQEQSCEIFINTGLDSDFDYTSKHGVDIIVGGELALKSVLKGRSLATSLEYDFVTTPKIITGSELTQLFGVTDNG